MIIEKERGEEEEEEEEERWNTINIILELEMNFFDSVGSVQYNNRKKATHPTNWL